MRKLVRNLTSRLSVGKHKKRDVLIKSYLVIAVLYGFAVESLIIKE